MKSEFKDIMCRQLAHCTFSILYSTTMMYQTVVEREQIQKKKK